MRFLSEGQIIRGTYEVERFLGSGAFAEVYRVKHRFLGRQAMKVFKMVGMTIEETEEMLNEAVLLSRMGHPNIVRVFDANVTDTSRGISGFFTMEYVAGGTLEQFWRSHGQQFVPVPTVVELVCQVCRGLAVAHSETPPVIHRDIKPQNILVGYDGAGLRVKVSDFGLAKRVNPLTMAATAKGTRAFKPPETFRESHGDSCAADVWAVGSILYLLLTDRLPYAQLGESDALDPTRFERPLVPPSQLNVSVDPGLDQIIYRALARRPTDRHPTTVELLDDLAKWRPGHAAASRDDAMATYSTEDSKIALGPYSSADEERARIMTRRALDLARRSGQLMDAADLMEEALNMAPHLREEYENQLQLWRRGVSM